LVTGEPEFFQILKQADLTRQLGQPVVLEDECCQARELADLGRQSG